MRFLQTILRKSHTFLHFPMREKIWTYCLYPASGAIRLALVTMPFRMLAPLLGEHRGAATLLQYAKPEQQQTARRIGGIVTVIARHTPWDSKCLVQAIMACLLLRWYDIPYAVYLGVANDSGASVTRSMKAHAWTTVGPIVITGRQGHRAYTVTATFAFSGRTRKRS